jgi:molybdate transport system regulatory protein
MRVKLRGKIWIEVEGKPALGKGGIMLLKEVERTGSIAAAARELGMSYKFAWEYMKRIEFTLGGVEMRKGGAGRGGSIISPRLKRLMELYEEAQREVEEVMLKYEERFERILESSE